MVGEGAGILVLETLENARAARRADPCGDGRLRDERRRASHNVAPPRTATGPCESCATPLMTQASRWQTWTTSIPTGPPRRLGDVIESRAMERLFGKHSKNLAVSSTKSMTGHLLGGAGGLEAGIAALAVRDQIAPPTINLDRPGPGCNLDYVPNVARSMEIEYSLSNSFGFGGTNGALLFRRYSGR